MRATEAQLASAKAQAAIMSKRVGRLLLIPPTSTSLIDEKSGEITGKYCGIFASRGSPRRPLMAHGTCPPKRGAGVTKVVGSADEEPDRGRPKQRSPGHVGPGPPCMPGLRRN